MLPSRKDSWLVIGISWMFLFVLADKSVTAGPGGPTFPTSGYGTILRDVESPSVPDNIDLIRLDYQQDGTYAFFRLTVAGTASFASDRHYLYFDLDADGLPDRRLYNTSSVRASMETWTGVRWDRYSEAWCQDPNDTPDDHLDFACLLSNVNGGNFQITAVAADTPSADDRTIRDPKDNPNFTEVTTGSINPTAVAVCGFSAIEDSEKVRLTWRLTAPQLVIGFNLYQVTDGQREPLNQELILADHEIFIEEAENEARSVDSYQLETLGADGLHHVVATIPIPITN